MFRAVIQPADPSDMTDEREEKKSMPADQLKKELEEAVEIELKGLEGGSFLAVVMVRRQRSDSSEIAEKIIELGAARDIKLYPAVYGEKDRPLFERVVSSVASPMGRDECDGDPITSCRFYMGRIDRYLVCLEWIRSCPDVPKDLVLGFASILQKEALDLLYGTKGLRFSDGTESIDLFQKNFGSTGFFDKGDKSLYYRLIGERYKTLYEQTERRPDEACCDTTLLLDEVEGFLERFGKYCRHIFSTEKERTRRAKIRKLALPLSFAVILALLTVLYLVGRPSGSTVDRSRITTPGGIVGHYYNGMRFERKVLERVDRQINFSTNRSPASGVGYNRFSVRWDGYVYIPQGGSSYLCVEVDDGARVYIDGRVVIDDWAVQPMHRSCRKVRLKKGWFPLKVEYFEETQKATIRLLWGKESRKASLVPALHLCCMR